MFCIKRQYLINYTKDRELPNNPDRIKLCHAPLEGVTTVPGVWLYGLELEVGKAVLENP